MMMPSLTKCATGKFANLRVSIFPKMSRNFAALVRDELPKTLRRAWL